MTTYSYDFYKRLLAGYKLGKDLPVHDGQPHPGFYRKRMRKGGPFVPVAIFESQGELLCRVGFKDSFKFVDPSEQWLWVVQHPVAEADYRSAVESGEWPDTPRAVMDAPPLNHNEPADAREMLDAQIETIKESAQQYEEIADDVMADRAQAVRSKALELAREVEKSRKAEKQPWLDGGNAVDEKWKPLYAAASSAADHIRRILSAYETKKAGERERILREQIERQRQEAEAAARRNEPAPAPAPLRVPEQRNKLGGGYGRRASVRDAIVFEEIIDATAAFTYLLVNDATFAGKFTEYVRKSVERGVVIPGVKTSNQKKVV